MGPVERRWIDHHDFVVQAQISNWWLFQKEKFDAQMDEEMRLHLEISYTRVLPINRGGLSMPLQQIEGYTPPKNEFVTINFTAVGPRYFETMGIPMLQTANQPLDKGSSVVWVNESFARKYWPGGAPIGKRIGEWIVNGVVKDSQLKNLTDKPGPYLYIQSL